MQTEPGFGRTKKWTFERITPGNSISASDLKIDLDPGYLNGLNEAERGEVRFTLRNGDSVIVERVEEIRVLAREEWGGFHSMAELLAAFVMPNDPAVAKILKKAGDILAQHGHSSALDGYQQRDPGRAFMLGAAIWSAIAAEGLTYTNPPSSFELVGQKTRRPGSILSDGLATCLDSSLLFAAVLEAVGLNPVLILIDGHCFTGFWLVEQTFNNLIETDSSEVRKGLSAKELITFETTLITSRPPVQFQAAIDAAKVKTHASQEEVFLAAIDITRARMAQIRPLASHDHTQLKETPETQENFALPLPKAPVFTDLPPEQTDEKPKTPEGRIDRWQRKLLDLSLRNRLLNFRATKQSVPFYSPDVSLLEDHLSDQKSMKIISLPEHNPMGDRDARLFYQETGEDIDAEFAKDALERHEVPSTLSKTELDNRLTNLYRAARNDLAEGGTNTLFLAVGFLKWKRAPEDEKSYRAPLLLIPVKLVRKSALSAFHLRHHEDEIRFNSTLIQLLKKDFDRDLSQFEADLPTDERGIDVPQVLELMRRAVREIPGFEVIDEISLSTFSFAKYLMWKDLVDRTTHLKENRVVCHLIDNPDKPFEPGVYTSIPKSTEIDQRYQPAELVHPLPADSSQLAAIMAAAEGHDFVLIGPPGTGKSQTIANMIAQCLAENKTVLFVAEKTAALDVVYRRLCQHGLGDICLELHSRTAERRKFLDQLERSWNANRKAAKTDWIKVNEKLLIKRNALNQYVSALHQIDESGWSVYQAMGIAVKFKQHTAPRLEWEGSLQITKARYEKLIEMIDELALTYGAISPAPALQSIKTTEWSTAWEERLLSSIAQIRSAVTSLQGPLQEFVAAIGLKETEGFSLDFFKELRILAGTLTDASQENYRIIFDKDFARASLQIKQLSKDLKAFEKAQKSTEAFYKQDEIEQIPVKDLDYQWRQVKSKLWPLSYFAKKQVRKLLQTYATSGTVDPEKDLPQIELMQKYLEKINGNSLADRTHHWKGPETNTEDFQRFLEDAERIRQTIISFGKTTNSLKLVSSRLAPVLIDDSEDHPILVNAQNYITAIQTFIESCNEFKHIAGAPPFTKVDSDILQSTLSTLGRIEAHRVELRKWISWMKVREKTDNAGLGVFIDSLEQEQIQPENLRQTFEIAFVRWWLPKAIDRSDILRQFQSFQHEEIIRDFCDLDQTARIEAANQVQKIRVHHLPDPDSVARKSELGLLRHQMRLKRPSKAIREVISGMPETFSKLVPCLLMSPLSIAQYLPPEQAMFDVVIFDEASQITTWDAIGAIARGRQTIIVGDPKQLPPTNFFGRVENDEEDDDLEDHERDLESILDEATASGLPLNHLTWHYRSRHESLISFSNWNYYDNKLFTYPSAVTADQAVSMKHLPNAIYDRGKSRTNRIEAETLVADAVIRMKSWLNLPEDNRPTLGVITFNSQQQSLIQDLFDQSLRDSPELEWFFEDARIEPTVVKNLENVQGDERDVMLFSITNGPDEARRKINQVLLTFGALNREGGERRLNVAVTRARQELMVYVSFLPEQLKAESSRSKGLRDLKSFLEYAQKGRSALLSGPAESKGEFESPFEEAVASKLSEKGWEVLPQIGVSKFRVDLGVIHPDRPGTFLAGIECDGATYHRSATARDRDKIREQVLRNLGWEILRIWSPDWWYDPDGALAKIENQLQDLLQQSRNKQTEEKLELGSTGIENEEAQVEDASSNLDNQQNIYCETDLTSFIPEPDLFYETSYQETLRSMIDAILETEAPIRDDVLAQKIARAHGWARTGRKIREHVFSFLETATNTNESTGRFIWNQEAPATMLEYRFPDEQENLRPVDEITIAELCGFIDRNKKLLLESDPALSIAREMGISRLNGSSRERFEEAIQEYQSKSV
ncbi:DUF3320 domain-containing protein [Gimesia aquarii]|nr:DUF3320 domain-containing protein [Gimesia aquarii]